MVTFVSKYEGDEDQLAKKAAKGGDYHHGELRQALVKAAVELISEREGASFGLRDLAAKVGVSHPALYRHFADRSALFLAISIEGFTLYAETQKHILETAPQDPAERLVLLGRNHLAFALKYPAYFRVMFGAKVSEHKLDDDTLRTVAPPTLELIAKNAAQLGKENPFDFTLILWSTVHGISLLYLDRQLVFFGKSTAESVFELVEQSVRNQIKAYTS
jgi:AcrR family transcriptional regulator